MSVMCSQPSVERGLMSVMCSQPVWEEERGLMSVMLLPCVSGEGVRVNVVNAVLGPWAGLFLPISLLVGTSLPVCYSRFTVG